VESFIVVKPHLSRSRDPTSHASGSAPSNIAVLMFIFELLELSAKQFCNRDFDDTLMNWLIASPSPHLVFPNALNHEPESPMRTIRKNRLRNSGLDEFRISGTRR